MEVINTNEAKDDRKAELQAFDETKAGVKGLVDAVINHGIPSHVLEEMKHGAIRAPATNWRDTFRATIAPLPPNPEKLPSVCRDVLLEYTNQVMKLGDTLFELLSEAIGLEPNHLKNMGCTEGLLALGYYNPACPQPELTLGTSKHAENDFLTVILQDNIGGLQVQYQNHWVDVPPTPGALELISNDKSKSVDHRILANKVGPRVSLACFFMTNFVPNTGCGDPDLLECDGFVLQV
ncbi:hypothetical protein HAX54_001117 [Datura stramonium]|uniref:Fe2OG dioxygenase domain-containing protein n=1 Tax=Datura stramonium TaxID=4076 RepID=A0ABS8RS96_DATST|nr:hypothetical protein [Datura stramonium]